MSNNGPFAFLLSGVVVAIMALFLFSGGDIGGKKTIQGDADLPPVATASGTR